ncbi:uncharacterized protein LOC123315529 [Coccinella septempunctata]|uniref:uncharacterized protein LOC123315527 n=1 Tax=Coccinella septempunctata TaxID=41139 RepID=UPI001D0641C5|nr:uncharacterized protein LOC123315527 [Coccinella septempunctata]XP_044757192.1 uncharacterized protein LOC123315529 [Coccinella septempunctata]
MIDSVEGFAEIQQNEYIYESPIKITENSISHRQETCSRATSLPKARLIGRTFGKGTPTAVFQVVGNTPLRMQLFTRCSMKGSINGLQKLSIPMSIESAPIDLVLISLSKSVTNACSTMWKSNDNDRSNLFSL